MAPDIIERWKASAISIASALSSALTIYPCQSESINVDSLNSNFLQLGRRSGGRPQRTVHPRRLPVNTVIHTTLVGLEPATFRLLVRRATSSSTDSPVMFNTSWDSLGVYIPFTSSLYLRVSCEPDSGCWHQLCRVVRVD